MSTNFTAGDLISQAEAARIRGITRQAVARLVAKGRVKVWVIGGKSFLSRAEIEAFIPKTAGRPPK